MFRTVFYLLVPAIAFIATPVGGGSASADSLERTSAEGARAAVSQATGIPSDRLTIAKEMPLADTGIRQFKLLDADGNIHGVALDAGNKPVSDATLERALREIDNRGFEGKLEAELADRLARRPDGPVNVIIWLKGTTDAPLRGDRVTGAEYETKLRTVRTQIAAIQNPIADQLRVRGQRVIYRAQHAPLVVAAATPSAIRAMADRSDVERVYLERVHKPRLNVSRVAVQADVVNARGITGAGRRVGIVEPGRVAAHTNLPAARRILCRPGASAAVNGHKTNVAGVIQSNHAAARGVAPGITIIDGIGANFSDAEMMAATDCVIANGAGVINMSFGSETNGVFNAFARFVDRTIYNTGRSIAVAVSNICANRMGSPEIAFNALAVGSFSDRNTLGFGDDVHSCSALLPAGERHSAFLDPISPSNDREEPDIVAPGHRILTTNTTNGFSDTIGTSFAAPHVTGGVGLLTHRRPTLVNKAEEVRAILMASARHNIEGASRLSEQDGAGAITLAAADRVELNGQSLFITTPGGSQGFPLTISFSAAVGERVRVAIAWAHKSPGGDTLTRPTTDLDLRVFNPANAFLASSVSFDNNYEIVEFIAASTGTYTARINNFRPSAGNEFIGFATSRSSL